MARFLTAQQTLDRLVTDHPKRNHGACKLGVGFGVMASAFPIGLYLASQGMPPLAEFASVLGEIGLLGGSGLALWTDGFDILTPYEADPHGPVYFRNGFSRIPSRSNTWFGFEVDPVDTIEDLRASAGSHILVNGLCVESHEYRKGERGRRAYDAPFPHYITVGAVARTRLDGDPVRLLSIDNGEVTKRLGLVPRGTHLYAFGHCDGSSITVKKFGPAYEVEK